MGINITHHKNDFINTFGGESSVGDYDWDEYGIQLGDVTIDSIPAVEMKELGRRIINHLILNGHRAKIRETGEQDQREELVFIS